MNCEGSTIEHSDGRFEVVCSIHGSVITYDTLAVKIHGAKEMQRLINHAWDHHAEPKPRPTNPALN